MVESVGNIAAGIGAGAARPAHVSSRMALSQDVSQSGSLIPEIKRLSPSMHADPVSGVLVVEYLSGEGDVTTQLPSAVALAYLRSGLTETGQPRERVEKDASMGPAVLA